MKKLIVALSLAALTLPVFAKQASGQTAPPAEQQSQHSKKNKKKRSSKKPAETTPTTPEKSAPAKK